MNSCVDQKSHAHTGSHPARSAARYADLATGISFATLLLTMFALTPWTQPTFTSLAFDLELCLLAQMLGLAAWKFLRHPPRPELSY